LFPFLSTLFRTMANLGQNPLNIHNMITIASTSKRR
jgi:hypothetical protein